MQYRDQAAPYRMKRFLLRLGSRGRLVPAELSFVGSLIIITFRGEEFTAPSMTDRIRRLYGCLVFLKQVPYQHE